MTFPEITALGRLLARSNARDNGEQALNVDRIREAQAFLAGQGAPGLAACLEAAAHLVAALTKHGAGLQREEVLGIACRLVATVEKSVNAEGTSTRISPVAPTPPAATSESARPGPSMPSIPLEEASGHDAGEGVRAPMRLLRTSSPPGLTLRAELPRLNDMVLGEILVELGHVSREDVVRALEFQAQDGSRIGEVLLRLGATTSGRIADGLRLQESLRRSAEEEPEDERPTRGESPARGGDGPACADGGLRVGFDLLLGEVLVSMDAVTVEEVDRALVNQLATGMRLGEALVDMGAVTWQDIEEAADKQKRLRFVAGLPALGPRSLGTGRAAS